jgi:hypothetical protein
MEDMPVTRLRLEEARRRALMTLGSDLVIGHCSLDTTHIRPHQSHILAAVEHEQGDHYAL